MRSDGCIFTTRTPNGTRMVSAVRCTMCSPSLAPARSTCAETSPGAELRWMMPGEARSRTSTAFTGSPVSSRSRGSSAARPAPRSRISEVFSPAITNHSTRASSQAQRASGGRFSSSWPSHGSRRLRSRAPARSPGRRPPPTSSSAEQRLLQRARRRGSRRMRPPTTSEMAPVSSETTTATASVSSVTPMAARCRLPSSRDSSRVDGEGQEAGGGGHAVALHDHRAVVQRRAGVEDADEQVVGDERVEARCRSRCSCAGPCRAR